MKRKSVIFIEPYKIEIKEEPVPKPGTGELVIATHLSAISAGTELLVYRGLVPSEMMVDTTIRSLEGTFQYPLKYGYISVGTVIATGTSVESNWVGQQVFCFHPHESHFLARPEEVIPIPDNMESQEALFLPNMETAVNFLMDGRPMIGERVVVLGQGIIGLLTTALLAQFPLPSLISFDKHPLRREHALSIGADVCFDPEIVATPEKLQEFLIQQEDRIPADLIYELSGNPHALNLAIQLAGVCTRIVIGSWYGQKRAELDLGGQFHRSRIQLISSQVSSIAPELTGRWTKRRRIDVVFDMIKRIVPARFITHTFNIDQTARAFEVLDTHPEEALQVVLTY